MQIGYRTVLPASVLAAPWTAAAQSAATPSNEAAMTLGQIIQAGGALMYVLGALSVLGLAYVIYLALTLRSSAVIPRALREDVADALSAGRIEEARTLCRRNRSAYAALADTALACVERSPASPDNALLQELLEGEGGRQASRIQNQIQYLLDIAVVAPMLGLLGTVLGMLQAFNSVALDIAKARPQVLADGVAKALITTAAGLIVGIPAMVAYAYFRGKGGQLVSQLESAAAELLLRIPRKDRMR